MLAHRVYKDIARSGRSVEKTAFARSFEAVYYDVTFSVDLPFGYIQLIQGQIDMSKSYAGL